MIKRLRFSLLIALLVYISTYYIFTRFFAKNYGYAYDLPGKRTCVFYYLSNPYLPVHEETGAQGISDLEMTIARMFWPIMKLDPSYEHQVYYIPNPVTFLYYRHKS